MPEGRQRGRAEGKASGASCEKLAAEERIRGVAWPLVRTRGDSARLGPLKMGLPVLQTQAASMAGGRRRDFTKVSSKRQATLCDWLVRGAVAVLVLAGWQCGNPNRAATLELKLGHVAQPGSLIALSAEEFARRANEKLSGTAKVIVFGSSQLGNDEILLQKLKLETVDFALPSTIMSSVVDAFGLFEMPYLVKDRRHMRRIEEEIFLPKIAPLAEAKGYRIVAVWENGFRHITNNVRPIVVPDDLPGIKLRTPRGRWRVKLFQSFGANPTPMPLSEVFVALQTGVIDGQENPLAQTYGGKFFEVQEYLSLTGHVYSPAYLTAGSKKWAKLPVGIRLILETAARETQGFVAATAEQMDQELLEKLKGSSMQVNTADRASFLAASGPIYKEFTQSVPGAKEWVEMALALANP